jgi:hypothetical protein
MRGFLILPKMSNSESLPGKAKGLLRLINNGCFSIRPARLFYYRCSDFLVVGRRCLDRSFLRDVIHPIQLCPSMHAGQLSCWDLSKYLYSRPNSFLFLSKPALDQYLFLLLAILMNYVPIEQLFARFKDIVIRQPQF